MTFFNAPRWAGNPTLARRAVRMATCAHKQRHQSQGAADAHLRALVRRFGVQVSELQPYACNVCGGWHLGRLHRRAA